MLAHRVAWERVNGPIPPGMCVCHKCDNRICVNPAHMFWGSISDNHADMVSKQRQAKGLVMPHSKLSVEKVRDARARYAAGGISYQRLADEYGVSRMVMRRAIEKKNWKHA